MHALDRLGSLMNEVAPLTQTAARNAFIVRVRTFREHVLWRFSKKKVQAGKPQSFVSPFTRGGVF